MSGGRWPECALEGESFDEFVERLKPERETQPDGCSHCGTEGVPLTNYSRHYGGNVGAHWLCDLCETTLSASRLGAGGSPDPVIKDIAQMLHVMRLGQGNNPPHPVWIVWEDGTPSPAHFSLEAAIQTKDGLDERHIAVYRGEWRNI